MPVIRIVSMTGKYGRRPRKAAYKMFSSPLGLHTLPWLGVAVFSVRSFCADRRSRCNPEALALMTRPSLILKPLPIGWNQEHYDVLEDGVVVGRIFLMPIGPRGDRRCGRAATMGAIERPAHGYEPTREAGLAAFAKSWRRQ